MSHRRHPEPQWLRELAERCLPAARGQLPQTLSKLIRPVAVRHGISAEEVAVRIAKLWVLQGHLEDHRLVVND